MSSSPSHALSIVRHAVEALHVRLRLDTGLDIETFTRTLDAKLLLPLDPDYPVLAAVIGGGSAGKSSLFNALVGKRISPVQAMAGLSRRILAAINPRVAAREGFIQGLFDPFGALPEPLQDSLDLLEPGPPRYVIDQAVPPNLVLLDTPDFDTGDQEEYRNRQLGKPVLEASDVFVYIFTNATYNNRDNTRFVRNILSSVGRRKSILVYRCSRTLGDEDVLEHARVVAGHLYDDQAGAWVLGVYRVHEDDQVAAGEAMMTLLPTAGSRDIHETLAAIRPGETRREIIAAALADVQRDAAGVLQHARTARLQTQIYRDAVRIATSWAVANALRTFPQTELLQRFAEIWEQGQPASLKFIKSIGKITAWPMKPALAAARKIRRAMGNTAEPEQGPVDPNQVIAESVGAAANDLRRRLLAEEMIIETTDTDAGGGKVIQKIDQLLETLAPGSTAGANKELLDPGKRTFNLFARRPAGLAAQAAALSEDSVRWEETLAALVREAMTAAGTSEAIDGQLRVIAEEFRGRMTRRQKAREFLTASLGPLPAVGAATYILTTGDMVAGAPTIYAKLSGLFGLHDLMAVLAVPAAQGVDTADKKNLEALLAGTFEAWFHDKRKRVEEIMHSHVSGGFIVAADSLLRQTDKPAGELQAALDLLQQREVGP